MKPILIVYGTSEGQTRKIAEFLAAALQRRGHEAHLVDSNSPAAAQVQPAYSAAIAAGSLHHGKFQPALVHFIKSNVGWLNAVPGALVSVSLTAMLDDAAERAELDRLTADFCRDTGWAPGLTKHVAGALRYTQYDYFRLLVMKLIAHRHGGDTDASRDHEYTDWDDLERFAGEFATAAAARAGG
jgi:menaquinone-dependent protoporphyrinogen oxidase